MVEWGKSDKVVSWGQQDKAVSWGQTDASSEVVDQAQGLVSRFGSQLYNQLVPSAVVGTLSTAKKISMGWPFVRGERLEAAIQEEAEFHKQFDVAALAGKYGEREKKRAQKRQAKYTEWEKKGGPPEMRLLPVPDAKTFAQKGVDVAAALTAFTAQIALLRKAMPGQSDAVLWEMQNLMTGGTPGHGAAMYGLFSVPGKVIKGTGKVAKAGRLATESATLGSVTAVEQMLTEGEIRWEDVAVSAGIPVALRSLSYVKAKLRRGDRDIINALTQIRPDLIDRLPSQRQMAAVTQQQRTGARKRFAKYAGKEPLKGKKQPRTLDVLEQQAQSLLQQSEAVYKSTAKDKAGKLKSIADQMDLLDREITTVKSAIAGRKLKNLKKFARSKGIDIPKDASRADVVKALTKGKKTKTKGLYPTVVEKQAALIPTEKGYVPKLGVGAEASAAELAKHNYLWNSTDAKLTTAKLRKWTSDFVPVGQEERAAYVKELRGKQAGAGRRRYKLELKRAKAGDITYLEAIKRIGRSFIGKADVPEFDPPKLTDVQWDIFAQRINEVYGINKRLGRKELVFKLKNSADALDKLKTGHIPTNYEFGLLEPVLGTDTTQQLYDALQPHRTYGLWDVPRIVRDALKTKFGYDPQILRQASFIATRHPKIYTEAFLANVKAYASAEGATKIEQQLKNSPGWKLAVEEYNINALGTKPWAAMKAGTKLQQYGEFPDWLRSHNNPILKGWGNWLHASERGANVGTNVALKKLVDISEKELSRYRAKMSKRGKLLTDADVSKWREQRGKDINALMKRIVAKNPRARDIQQVANWFLFSPAYTVSRPIVTGRTIKRLFTGKTLADKTFMLQSVLGQIGTYWAIGELTAHVAHKYRMNNPVEEPAIDGSSNPSNALFGKIRVGKHVVDLSFGDASWWRLLARIGTSSYAYCKSVGTGKMVTEVGGEPVRSAGEEVSRYLSSRETVLLGLARTLATGKDWMGQPLADDPIAARALGVLKASMPLGFLVSMIEAGTAEDMWESMMDQDFQKSSIGLRNSLFVGGLEVLGAGVLSYPVRATAVRTKFRDVIAEEAYGKKWDELDIFKQASLKQQYVNEFELLKYRVDEEKAEQLGAGTDFYKKESKKIGRVIRKQLSKEVREILKPVSLNVNRRPKEYYLDDERLNLYIKYIVEELNKSIPSASVDVENLTAKKKILDAYVTLAKNKAMSRVIQEEKK